MQKEQLKQLIIKRLSEISILKGVVLTEQHYLVWSEKILKDFDAGLLKDPESGFKKLESEKSYGGLDYSVFLNGAANKSKNSEEAWSEVIASAKHGGLLKISARSAKALNSLGGMTWLRDADAKDINWQRKEFMEIYENTQEPYEIDFRCEGLIAPMYLESGSQILLE